MELESSGGSTDLFAASVAACCARASGVQTRPVITAAAPMTALRIMNDRRLRFEESADSTTDAGDSASFLVSCSFMGLLEGGMIHLERFNSSATFAVRVGNISSCSEASLCWTRKHPIVRT